MVERNSIIPKVPEKRGLTKLEWTYMQTVVDGVSRDTAAAKFGVNKGTFNVGLQRAVERTLYDGGLICGMPFVIFCGVLSGKLKADALPETNEDGILLLNEPESVDLILKMIHGEVGQLSNNSALVILFKKLGLRSHYQLAAVTARNFLRELAENRKRDNNGFNHDGKASR